MLTIGSLFSGIGGLELGLEWAGLGPTLWQVESDEFCRKVLERHWPDADRSVTDVKQAGRANLVPVDLICGGAPCQDLSAAGKGAGITGVRSGLWFEFHRVVWALEPTWVVFENVGSAAIRWVDHVMEGLEQLGYEALPVPLSAVDVGAPHRRARVFVVAHSDVEPLRQQPRWKCRQGGQGSSLPWEFGSCRGAPGPPNWATSPSICGVDDGVPRRMDRLRGLGNAVVPQCAEVIGWVVREAMSNAVRETG